MKTQILNLLVEVEGNTVVEILEVVEKLDVESSTFYFYDLLEVNCNMYDIDFGTLMVRLYDDNIKVGTLFNVL